MFDYFGEKELEKQKKFRQKRDIFLKKLVIFLTRYKITANHITYFGIFLFFISCLFIKICPILAGVLLLFYCLSDGIDGPLSRYQNTQSKAGSLLDIFADQLPIIILPLLSIIIFKTNPMFAYLFSMFYIIEIFLLTILNALKIKFGFVLRVKYFYYVIFIISVILNKDFLLFFHIIFGVYYIFHSLFLYFKLINHYKNS